MLFSYPRNICQEEEGPIESWRGGPTRPRQRRGGSERKEAPQSASESGAAAAGKPDEWAEAAGVVSPELLTPLITEIANLLKDEKLNVKDKVLLLEKSNYVLALAAGRGVPFKTEQVVRWIVIYSMIVVIVLAGLTAVGRLPEQVTTSFIGTVVGGLIATVAQKLGKI